MKKRRILLSVALLGLLMGMAGTTQAATVAFQATDQPGSWFDCSGSAQCTPLPSAREKSFAVINLGDSISFDSKGQANTLHTAVSLVYPTGAQFKTANAPPAKSFDVDLEPNQNNPFTVTPDKAGLYVFFCDIHPYMFAGVIVHDEVTHPGVLELGTSVTLENVIGDAQAINVPTASNLALRLVHTFFIATDPTNWQHFSLAAQPKGWKPAYPHAQVLASADGTTYISNPLWLDTDVLLPTFGETDGKDLEAAIMPSTAKKGVGQVWVDTQFEKTSKLKPGTATAVDALTWKVTNKVALSLNNPHNMWTDRNQTVIYQTNWFDTTLSVFDIGTGGDAINRNIQVGPAPAHVMTRTNNDQVHVSLNGGNDIVELDPLPTSETSIRRNIPMTVVNRHYPEAQEAHPHAHWMSADGKMMVTPNPDTGDSTLYDFAPYNHIASRTPTGHFSIAASMMPDSSKYYVANFLDSTISVIKINAEDGNMPTAHLFHPDRKINLLPLTFESDPLVAPTPSYNPLNGHINGIVGALPIQTPVSPDGKYMITANTLTGNVVVTDTKTDKVVAMVQCDPGCHGVQFGAKQGGGYYAYVSSKFSNRMIVIDPDPNGVGQAPDNGSNAVKVGSVLLTTANPSSLGVKTDAIGGFDSTYEGMGGQGVLPIPLVYNGWVQNLPDKWKKQLTYKQIHPIHDENQQ